METSRQFKRVIQGLMAATAIIFGIVSMIAGARVIGGADPGYAVYRPLVIYNAAMGASYLVAGIALWRNLELGRIAAGIIFVLNLLVLGGIVYLYQSGHVVAIESVRAMSFRTAIWLALFVGASGMWRGREVIGS